MPEDRKRQGLVLSMTRAEQHDACRRSTRLSRCAFIRRGAERALARTYFERLRVRAPRARTRSPPGSRAATSRSSCSRSGWPRECRILILDEPTRGVDVGAKAEIHALIDELAAEGSAVILISSELPEVLNLSTRILVLREGRVAGELPRETRDAGRADAADGGSRGVSCQ